MQHASCAFAVLLFARLAALTHCLADASELVELRSLMQVHDKRLESLEARVGRLELAAGVAASPEDQSFALSLRVEHLGRCLSHLADQRDRSRPMHGSRVLDAALADACPAGSFPAETSGEVPYRLCFRYTVADAQDATINIFGHSEDALLTYNVLRDVLWDEPTDSTRVVVVDVGASIGAVTLLLGVALRKGGFRHFRLLALEPEPGSADLLRGGVVLNDLQDHVEVLEMAASHREGMSELAVFHSEVSRSLLLPKAFGSRDARDFAGLQGGHAHQLPYERVLVPTRPLADVLADEERVHLLKLDAEGHEVHVLLGLGTELLSRVDAVVFEFRAWGLEEVSSLQGGAALLHLLSDRKFAIFCIAACAVELASTLRPEEERPPFLDSGVLFPEHFSLFIDLSLRLRAARRDFNAVAFRWEVAERVMRRAERARQA